jgi:hypothetical protein
MPPQLKAASAKIERLQRTALSPKNNPMASPSAALSVPDIASSLINSTRSVLRRPTALQYTSPEPDGGGGALQRGKDGDDGGGGGGGGGAVAAPAGVLFTLGGAAAAAPAAPAAPRSSSPPAPAAAAEEEKSSIKGLLLRWDHHSSPLTPLLVLTQVLTASR